MADSDEMDVRMTALEQFVLRRINTLEENMEANFNQTRQHLKVTEGSIISLGESADKEINELKNSRDLMDIEVRHLKELSEANISDVPIIPEESGSEDMPDVHVEERIDEHSEKIRTSTPRRKSQKPAHRIPRTIEEINPELSEKLSETYAMVMKENKKDKLTKIQLAYVHYFISSTSITGKSEETTQLISNGIRDGMWHKGWKPTEVKGDFYSYLKEKIKGIVKRNRVSMQMNKLTEHYENIRGGHV